MRYLPHSPIRMCLKSMIAGANFLLSMLSTSHALPVSRDTLVLIDMGGYQNGAAEGWNTYEQLLTFQAYPVADRSALATGVTVTSLDDYFYSTSAAAFGQDAVYDGVHVPKEARDDYFYKNGDLSGTTARLRFNGLPAGIYHVTVFSGRRSDTNQFAKIWAGATEPTSQNTGNFGAGTATVTVTVPSDGILYYRHLEDGIGGISGMILRKEPGPGNPPAPLFLLDFGAVGTTLFGAAEGWNTICEASSGNELRLTDVSGRNRAITLTVMDSSISSYSEAAPNAAATYDGVEIPLRARNDYIYRTNDTPGTSIRTRIDNLVAGNYRVTLFAGRTTDTTQFGKIWTGTTEPTAQNTGNFAKGSTSVAVTVATGQPLYYRHLEDGSGGISGMIIRHLPTPASVAQPYGIAEVYRYPDSGLFELIWNSRAGKTYNIESSANLTNWTTVLSGIASPTDARLVKRFAPLRGSSRGFFRVKEN